jgi:hypothetical protein
MALEELAESLLIAILGGVDEAANGVLARGGGDYGGDHG